MSEGGESLRTIINSSTPVSTGKNVNQKSWYERNNVIEEDWHNTMSVLVDEYCFKISCETDSCSVCTSSSSSKLIRCKTCTMLFCGKCDKEHHSTHLFHDRWLIEEYKWTPILTHEFITIPEGQVYSCGIWIFNYYA